MAAISCIMYAVKLGCKLEVRFTKPDGDRRPWTSDKFWYEKGIRRLNHLDIGNTNSLALTSWSASNLNLVRMHNIHITPTGSANNQTYFKSEHDHLTGGPWHSPRVLLRYPKEMRVSFGRQWSCQLWWYQAPAFAYKCSPTNSCNASHKNLPQWPPEIKIKIPSHRGGLYGIWNKLLTLGTRFRMCKSCRTLQHPTQQRNC